MHACIHTYNMKNSQAKYAASMSNLGDFDRQYGVSFQWVISVDTLIATPSGICAYPTKLSKSVLPNMCLHTHTVFPVGKLIEVSEFGDSA